MKNQKREEFPFLPALFTLTNALFGFLSLVFCFQGRYAWSALWIFMAAITDSLDGIVARFLDRQSEFGVQLDSLVDAFSFGAATAMLLYFWGLAAVHTAGVFFGFVFLASAILRLARYNVLQKTQKSRKHYVGLTAPSGALFLVSFVFLHPQPLLERWQAFVLALAIVVVSFLMVSKVRYPNLLYFEPRRKISLSSALLVAILIAGFVFYTRLFLFVFFSFNLLLGPGAYFFQIFKIKRRNRLTQKNLSNDSAIH